MDIVRVAFFPEGANNASVAVARLPACLLVRLPALQVVAIAGVLAILGMLTSVTSVGTFTSVVKC